MSKYTGEAYDLRQCKKCNAIYDHTHADYEGTFCANCAQEIREYLKEPVRMNNGDGYRVDEL